MTLSTHEGCRQGHHYSTCDINSTNDAVLDVETREVPPLRLPVVKKPRQVWARRKLPNKTISSAGVVTPPTPAPGSAQLLHRVAGRGVAVRGGAQAWPTLEQPSLRSLAILHEGRCSRGGTRERVLTGPLRFPGLHTGKSHPVDFITIIKP